jgi:hypothetical protein
LAERTAAARSLSWWTVWLLASVSELRNREVTASQQSSRNIAFTARKTSTPQIQEGKEKSRDGRNVVEQ